MKDVGPFSNVLFYFGGHAGEDANGQFILAANGDHILGSELRACLSTTKHKSVSVTAVFDACHSGESLGLPYNYESLSGIIKAGKCEGQAGSIPVVQIAAARRGQHAYSNQYMVKSPNGNPDRLAYHGQLTWSFVNYLKNAEHPSIKGLVAHLDKYCDPTGLQTPLVSVSHKP
ncbi:Ca(2+)-dependent cysteine protease [Tulasnella sp. 427]|nr:Ca(2+)-dependent cysteine protease [Tulasnella sp. 427]